MYYLLYGFLFLLSLLPFWILYGISDLFHFIVYHLWGYRKEVVMNNLAIAFPEKSEEERKEIAKQFYHNLIDSFFETIKLFSISKRELNRRFTCDYSFFNSYYEKGLSVQVHLGHFFNWEYANLSVGINSDYAVLVVYMPLLNRAMNRIFLKLRTRFGAKMIAATRFRKEFLPHVKSSNCLVFVADQNAGMPDSAYWSHFFGKLVPFVTGPEKTARLNNNPVLFVKFHKMKRGFYDAKFQLLSDAPRSLQEGELTKRMIAKIEESIREQPSNYLWSHRRWKHDFDPARHGKLVI
jgi:KDO2-lipid IV(A) lauroyltransferase